MLCGMSTGFGGLLGEDWLKEHTVEERQYYVNTRIETIVQFRKF